MKKGTEPFAPTEVGFKNNQAQECIQVGNQIAHFPGISIRLKIASDAMCALIGQCHGLPIQEHNIELINKTALLYADSLIKMEEETRNDT